MKAIGLGVLAIGVLIVLVALTKSGAAEYSDTLNIGLLNDKTNMTLAGGFTGVVGAIFAATGAVVERLGVSAAQSAPPVAPGDL
jgi:hypothetical protein